MNAILILIPVTLLLVGVAVWAFFWATNGGQFDDLDTPGYAILTDDARPPEAAPAAAAQEPPP